MEDDNTPAIAGKTPLATDELLLMAIDRLSDLDRRVTAIEYRLGTNEPAAVAAPSLPQPASELETRVASTFLNYLGLLVLLAGLGLLFAYWFESRSTLAILLAWGSGGILWALSQWIARRASRTFSLTLEGTALGLLYLGCYLSYAWWGMIPSLAAGIGMMLVAIRRAFARDSQQVAVFALAAAFIGPLFLRSVHSGESLIFGYLAVVNAAALWAGERNHWTGIRMLSLTGSHLVAGFWYATHPGASLALTAVFPVLTFLLFAQIAPGGKLSIQEIAVAILNSAGFLAASFSLLKTRSPALVVFAPAALGGIHLLLAAAWLGTVSLRPRARLYLWIAGVLIASGMPLFLPLPLAAMGWIIEAFAAGYWGTLWNRPGARNAGNLLSLAAALAIAFSVDSSQPAARQAMGAAAALLFSVSILAQRRLLDRHPAVLGNWEWTTHWMLAILAAAFPLLALTLHSMPNAGAGSASSPSLVTAALWSAYSMALCVIGWIRGSPFLRWTGVALLLVTSIRVLLIDTVAMAAPARIAAFLVLACLLLAISYLFQSRTKE